MVYQRNVPLGSQIGRLLQPFLHNPLIGKNSGRVKIDQSRRLMVRRKCGDGIKPAPHLGIGISFGGHFLKPRRPIQMEHGKCPDVVAFPGSAAIALGWTHSGITGEVVGNKAVRLQPVT